MPVTTDKRTEGVAPHWGAWIEMSSSGQLYEVSQESHPTGVRGLKYVIQGSAVHGAMSHPTGVRGLKFSDNDFDVELPQVAPHWGAWIEI